MNAIPPPLLHGPHIDGEGVVASASLMLIPGTWLCALGAFLTWPEGIVAAAPALGKHVRPHGNKRWSGPSPIPERSLQACHKALREIRCGSRGGFTTSALPQADGYDPDKTERDMDLILWRPIKEVVFAEP